MDAGDNGNGSGDSKSGVTEELRPKMVQRIAEAIKKHTPVCAGQQGMDELFYLADKFERKIFAAATDEQDYLQKIWLKIVSLVKRGQPSTDGGGMVGGFVQLGHHPGSMGLLRNQAQRMLSSMNGGRQTLGGVLNSLGQNALVTTSAPNLAQSNSGLMRQARACQQLMVNQRTIERNMGSAKRIHDGRIDMGHQHPVQLPQLVLQQGQQQQLHAFRPYQQEQQMLLQHRHPYPHTLQGQPRTQPAVLHQSSQVAQLQNVQGTCMQQIQQLLPYALQQQQSRLQQRMIQHPRQQHQPVLHAGSQVAQLQNASQVAELRNASQVAQLENGSQGAQLENGAHGAQMQNAVQGMQQHQ